MESSQRTSAYQTTLNSMKKELAQADLYMEKIARLKLALDIFTEAEQEYSPEEAKKSVITVQEEQTTEDVAKASVLVEEQMAKDGSDGQLLWHRFDTYMYDLQPEEAHESVLSYRCVV